jgi:hypothetical protein
MYICIYICIYIYVYIYVYRYMYIYLYTYAYIHICINKYMYVSQEMPPNWVLSSDWAITWFLISSVSTTCQWKTWSRDRSLSSMHRKPYQVCFGFLLLGCSVISVPFFICMLDLLFMPLAGLHFCERLDFVTPSL